MAAGAAGVVALVLGVVIGRASGGDDGDPAAATETATSVPAESTLALETLPPPPRVTTTTVRRTTTTTLLVEERTIDLGAPLAGRAMEIVGATGNAVVRIDVATGATRRIAASMTPDGPPTLIAGADWVVRPSWDPSRPTVVINDDGSTAELESSSGSEVFAAPDGESIWSVEGGVGIEGFRLVERLPSGEPTGDTVVSAGYVSGLDPLGGVIVTAPGGAYRIDGETTERLTSGQLLATSRSTLFVEECDETLTCQHAVVDRTTGARRPLDLTETFGDGVGINASGWWAGSDSMAPAGDAVFVTEYPTGPIQSAQRSGILDLTTGDFVEIPDAEFFQSPMLWSPDGELVMWLGANGLSVYDRTDGTTTVVGGDDPLRFTAFTVRALDAAG